MVYKTLPTITASIVIVTLVFSVNAQFKINWNGETWRYSQLWSNGKWGDTLDATIFTFNNENKPISTITYANDTGATRTGWCIKQKERVIFNTNDTTVQSYYVHRYYSNSKRCDSTVMIFTYNSNNQPVSCEYKIPGDDSYILFSDMWYEGNRLAGDSTNRILRDSFPPNPTIVTTYIYQKHLYTYTTSSVEISEFIWSLSSKTWKEAGKETTVFDSLNRVLTRTVQYVTLDTWINHSKDSCIYSGNKLTEAIRMKWDGDAWLNDYRTLYMSNTPPDISTVNVINFKKDLTHSFIFRPGDNNQFDLKGRYIGNSIKKADAFLINLQRSNTVVNVRIK